jgi:hypothetical protein
MNGKAKNDETGSADRGVGDRLVSLALKLGVLILSTFAIPQTAYFQNANLFEVKNLTSDIKHRFHLSPRDVKAIERLIDKENRSIVKIYARFSGSEPEYSTRLWRLVIDDRLAFESGIEPALTKVQKGALRSARARMESRLLEYLVRDYVGFLSQLLELDDLESDDVADLYNADVAKRCRLLVTHSSNPAMLQKEMENLTHETERKLRKILSEEHWKYYRELTEPIKAIA